MPVFFDYFNYSEYLYGIELDRRSLLMSQTAGFSLFHSSSQTSYVLSRYDGGEDCVINQMDLCIGG